MNTTIHTVKKAILCAMLGATATVASAENYHTGKLYEVSITNLTPGQPMARLMVASHKPGISYFTPGEAPNEELAILAEAGNGQPMAELLLTQQDYTNAVVADGGTPPLGSSSVIINAKKRDHISVGAMLGNTNDAFVALRDVDLPKGYQTVTYMAAAYDAGTETNDELCSTVPGPACGGEALSPDDDGEGIVYIHNGIHGIGGMVAADYDWRNPVAQITIKRID